MPSTLKQLIARLIPTPFERGQLSEADVEKYEKTTGSLPADYRELLVRTNGGNTIPHVVWTLSSQSTWERIIPECFCDLKGDWSPLPGPRDDWWSEALRDFLPIACDPGGNRVLMRLRTDDRLRPTGSLWFQDHERPSEVSTLAYVAPSFRSYLELFQPYDGDQHLRELKTSANVLDREDLDALDQLLAAGWRVNELWEHGNTLADAALIKGKRKLFFRALELGGIAPRFHLYAHHCLTEAEITEYLRTGTSLGTPGA